MARLGYSLPTDQIDPFRGSFGAGSVVASAHMPITPKSESRRAGPESADRTFDRRIGAGLSAETRRRTEMSAANVPTFDPNAYKETIRRQWQDAAEAWHRWGAAIERWLGSATERMLDLAEIGAGDRVLDVAAGAGGHSLAAARRVGSEGAVVATDISSNVLELAALEAERSGLANVEMRVLDGERLDVEQASFDAVISRVRFIYFPDQQAALRGMHRALKRGGKLAGIVYSTRERNEFFSIPVGIIQRRAKLPAPAPGQPGPFSFGSRALSRAPSSRPGSRRARSSASRRRCAFGRPQSVSRSSASHSARCSPLPALRSRPPRRAPPASTRSTSTSQGTTLTSRSIREAGATPFRSSRTEP